MNRTGKWSWASPDAQATFRHGGALELDFSSRVEAAVAADEEHALDVLLPPTLRLAHARCRCGCPKLIPARELLHAIRCASSCPRRRPLFSCPRTPTDDRCFYDPLPPPTTAVFLPPRLRRRSLACPACSACQCRSFAPPAPPAPPACRPCLRFCRHRSFACLAYSACHCRSFATPAPPACRPSLRFCRLFFRLPWSV